MPLSTLTEEQCQELSIHCMNLAGFQEKEVLTIMSMVHSIKKDRAYGEVMLVHREHTGSWPNKSEILEYFMKCLLVATDSYLKKSSENQILSSNPKLRKMK